MNNSKGLLKIYRSSAGSGKTFTLAKEYLKLVFANREFRPDSESEDYFKHILAITFTNDAANEMKERVLSNLKDISALKAGENHELLELIIQELKDEYPSKVFNREELILLSSRILKSILHRFSDFNIQTIDSFTNQIGRSFTRELNLPSNYEIYLDTTIKLNEAVDTLLSELSDSEQSLMLWLNQFVDEQINSGKSWNIDYHLKSFSQNLTDESKYELIEKVSHLSLEDYTEIKKILNKKLGFVNSKLTNMASEGLVYLKKEGLENDDLKGKSNSIKKYFELNFETPFSKELTNTQKSDLEKDHWIDSKLIRTIANGEVISSHISGIVRQMLEFQEENKDEVLILSSVLKNLYQLALLHRIGKILQSLKERDDQAFLSDLNEKIRHVVLNEPVPFIYEKAGVKFNHLLIDEFQDTSVFQWINLIPLISNSISEAKVSLIVGDAKQSIYGWRGARPEILVQLPNMTSDLTQVDLKDYWLSFSNNTNVNKLNSNWRSANDIVKFNNSFFEWLRTTNTNYPGLGGFYDDVVQNPQKNTEADIRVDVISFGSLNKENAQPLKSSFIINYIKECVQFGYTWSDIVILCRKKDEILSITDELLEASIPILTDESLLLKNSSKVALVIQVFEFLQEPGNEEKRFEIIFEISSHLEFSINDWKDIVKAIKEYDLEKFLKFIIEFFSLNTNVSQLSNGDIYSIGQSWIRALNLTRELEGQIYLDFFLDVIFDISNKSDSSISYFLDYWKEKKDKLSVSSSNEQNAIRIMTIHKSKGLEYPVVILPYPEWNFSPQSKSNYLWAEWTENNTTELPIVVLNNNKSLDTTVFAQQREKEINEYFIGELNALYVALTRAKSRLYILSSKFERKGNYLSNFINDFLENHDYSNQELSIDGLEVNRYQISKETKTMAQGITDTLKPWNNSKYTREKTNRNLRWSVENVLSHEQLEKISKGQMFHYLMSKYTNHSDTEHILELSKTVLDEKENKEEFRLFLDELAKNQETKELFNSDWEVLTERELLVDGKLLRPDRIQIREDKIVIIDYKTGKEDESHLKQIHEYSEALKRIYPKKSCQSYLIYFNPFKLLSGF